MRVAFALVLLAPALASGQTPDHLACYKLRDTASPARYTATLNGLTAEPGCRIKVPAKMLCVPTTKEDVAPAPPGTPAGPPAGRFLCYAVKCPRQPRAALPVADQFGSRSATPVVSKLLCAPESVPSTTTTTTTTTTTAPPPSRCCLDSIGLCLITSGPCNVGTTEGPTGSVCAAEGCTAPPGTPRGCCDLPGTTPTCVAFEHQSVCEGQGGGQWSASAVCTPDGCVP
jgi:hypothetical protein